MGCREPGLLSGDPDRQLNPERRRRITIRANDQGAPTLGNGPVDPGHDVTTRASWIIACL